MDVKCAVCGEPWDFYGISHGDMAKWEARLFKAGAGCPSCKGKPEESWEPTTLEDVEYGDLDPIHRIDARENFERGKVPKWERPADTLLWYCEGCGVQCVRDSDDGQVTWNLPTGANGRAWYYWHRYDTFDWAPTPHATIGKDSLCEGCTSYCYDCGAVLSSRLNYSDNYDPGNPFFEEGDCYGKRPRCVDCHCALPCDEDSE